MLSQDIQRLLESCKCLAEQIDEADTRNASKFQINDDEAVPQHFQRTNSFPIYRTPMPKKMQQQQQERTSPLPPIPIALRSKLDRKVLMQMQQNHQQFFEQPPTTSTTSCADTMLTATTPEPTQTTATNTNDECTEDNGWTCNMCTFRNNCYLTKCEQCDMPFLPSANNLHSDIVFKRMRQQQYLWHRDDDNIMRQMQRKLQRMVRWVLSWDAEEATFVSFPNCESEKVERNLFIFVSPNRRQRNCKYMLSNKVKLNYVILFRRWCFHCSFQTIAVSFVSGYSTFSESFSIVACLGFGVG